jgi:radial spoke head protein 1
MEYPSPPMGEDDEEEKPGDKFEGTMSHGVREGQGTYTFGVSGAVYSGNYVDNKKHGKGKMTFPDKSVFEGDWVEDVIQGSGTYIYASGDVYQASR